MIALSIKLTEELDKTSRKLARKLGISRSELIRQALANEFLVTIHQLSAANADRPTNGHRFGQGE